MTSSRNMYASILPLIISLLEHVQLPVKFLPHVWPPCRFVTYYWLSSFQVSVKSNQVATVGFGFGFTMAWNWLNSLQTGK